MKLIQLVEILLPALGEEGDFVFKAKLADYVKAQLAYLIRQDVERNALSKSSYTIELMFELESVDEFDTCSVKGVCDVRRTKNKVPKPIRFKDIYAPFISVKNLTSISESFIDVLSYVASFLINKLYLSKYKNIPYYTYKNGYIYVFNANALNHIRVTSAFEDIDEYVKECNNSDCDVNPLFQTEIPQDMVTQITQLVMSSFPGIRFNNSELKVENRNDE